MISVGERRNTIVSEIENVVANGHKTINAGVNTRTKQTSSLYIVFRKSSTVNNIKAGDPARIKIGFTSKNEPWERFKSYLSEGQEEALYLGCHIRIPYTDIPADKGVINHLRKKGYKLTRDSEQKKSVVKIGTEFIDDCPIEEIIKAVFEFFELDELSRIDLCRDKDFPMFDYQNNAHNKLVEKLKDAKVGEIIQYISPTRSGKSFTIANVVKSLFN